MFYQINYAPLPLSGLSIMKPVNNLSRFFSIELSVAITIFFFTSSATLEGLLMEIAPSFSIFCTLLRYLSGVHIVYYQWKYYHGFTVDRNFIIFYIIYTCFIFYDIALGSVYPLDKMLSVPESIGAFLLRTIFMLSLMISSKTIIENINIRLLCAIFLLFCLLPAMFYIHLVGFETFQVVSVENSEAQYIGALTFAYNNAYVIVLFVFFGLSLFKRKWLSAILVIAVIICVGYIFLASTKRGPILWTLVSILTCNLIKNKKNFSFYFKLSVILVVLYLLGPYILDSLSQFAPHSIERIYNMVYEGDTSDRLAPGDSDSGYTLAIEQFAQHPFWGSYFRLVTDGIFQGAYPHNIFLEIMITMGVFGLIPLLFFIERAFSGMSSILQRSKDDQVLACFAIFCVTLFTLITTGTICLNASFWVGLSLVLVIPKLKRA